jgi:hypothetical protein
VEAGHDVECLRQVILALNNQSAGEFFRRKASTVGSCVMFTRAVEYFVCKPGSFIRRFRDEM